MLSPNYIKNVDDEFQLNTDTEIESIHYIGKVKNILGLSLPAMMCLLAEMV